MITYFLAEIASWLLNIVSFLFSILFGWAFPPGIDSTIQWLFDPLKYFGWFLDLHFMGEIIVWYIGFITLWWSYKIVHYAFNVVNAFIHGGEIKHPTH